MLQRKLVQKIVGITIIGFACPALAQTAGEGSGSGVVGSGAMIRDPGHAERGGDPNTNSSSSKKPGPQSPDPANSGSNSPATNSE